MKERELEVFSNVCFTSSLRYNYTSSCSKSQKNKQQSALLANKKKGCPEGHPIILCMIHLLFLQILR